MSATFGVCFRYIILLVFETYGTQMVGNWKNVKNFIYMSKPHDRFVQKIALKNLINPNLK